MFKNLFNSVVASLTSAVSAFTDAVLSDDQKYAKASISFQAAIIYADGIVEDDEMEAAAAMIGADAKIAAQEGTAGKDGTEFNAMTCLAVEMESYAKIAALPGGMTGPVGKLQMKAKAKQFALDVPKMEDREMIIAQGEAMAGADGNIAAEEAQVIAMFRAAVK
jgi:hypothetical protein